MFDGLVSSLLFSFGRTFSSIVRLTCTSRLRFNDLEESLAENLCRGSTYTTCPIYLVVSRAGILKDGIPLWNYDHIVMHLT
jgi:hypothetical protein